jgi:hypothetical protein
MSKPHKIERLYAWIATDATGEDGIPAMPGPNSTMIPLVGSDKARIESLRPFAEAYAHRDGYPVRLVEFTRMIELERIVPKLPTLVHR